MKNKLIEFYHDIIRRQWIIGIADYSDDIENPDFKPTIKWVKDSLDYSWCADPFILSESDTVIHLLVEEFPYDTEKGRITKLVVDKESWRVIDRKVVLELDTYLSFPCYYRENGKLFIYPENSASGISTIYEYNETNDTLSKIGALCAHPLTDAVIYDMQDSKYILSTRNPYDNSNILDIYSTDGITSNPKPLQTIRFTENVARNAGRPFLCKGKMVRPAQISNSGYGEGIVLQEVKYNNGSFEFDELKRLYSPLEDYAVAFHTMNVFENKYIIFDAQGYKHKHIGPIIDRIVIRLRKLIRK